MDRYCIVTDKPWGDAVFSNAANHDGYWIRDSDGIPVWDLDKYKYVFYVFWSDKVPKELTEKGNCIGFHLCAGNYTSGGSPVQNAIYNGYEKGTVKAFVMDDGIDTGEVLDFEFVSLLGSAEEIYMRLADSIYTLIKKIVTGNTMAENKDRLLKMSCVNGGLSFKRRKPADSAINAGDLKHVYNQIRMMDAEGYPPAFLEVDGMRYEFSRASLKHDCVLTDVKITEIKDV